MSYFIVTFLIMILSISGMALGVIFSRKPLKGSCGGLGKIMGDKCQFCEKKGECVERSQKS